MGFFRSIAKIFDTGGIRLKLEAPRLFSFEDPALPVTVTMTGHKSEPRTVTEFHARLLVVEEDKDDNKTHSGGPDDHRIRMEWRPEGPYTVAPGETQTVQLELPLTADLASEIGGRTGKVFGALTKLSQRAVRYELQVGADVEGAKGISYTTHRLERRVRGTTYFGSDR